jgi:DNA-binding transcriptional LysR family regulator
MEYRQLVAFRTVARTLSFTQAAGQLRYAQSTVTAQIKGLEASLRVRLFDRRGGRVRLTESGERLLPYAERLLGLAEEARRAMYNDGRLLGKLVVGAGEVITTYRLPGLIEAFHHQHPDVYLSLQHYDPDATDVLRRIDLGEADVVLLHGTRFATGGLRVRMLCHEEMELVVALDHPFRRREAVVPADLAEVRSIVTGPHCVYARFFDTELGSHDVPPPTRLEFGTVEAVKRAVASGLGVSLLPRIAVSDALAAGELAVLPWSPATPLHTYAVWLESQNDSEIVQAFVSLVARVIAETAPGTPRQGEGGSAAGT